MSPYPVDKKRTGRSIGRAFSLPEVTISAAILSTITIALGLAMFRTQQRVADTQAGFTDLRTRNDVIGQITDDLRWAAEVNAFYSQAVACTVPAPQTPGVYEQIGYYLNSGTHELIRVLGVDGTTQMVVARNVTVFEVSGQAETQGMDMYFHNLKIRLQIGSDEQTLIERIIPLANRPIMSGWFPG